MLLTIIFGVLAVAVIVGGMTHPRAQQSPMLRLGSIFVGLALAVVALSILL
ncbi:MAG: hypothetical protein JJU45_02355 [Acidimicrobiia bacterium]|nr:hypothetical protein [Acidimicrobiia bacterium]